MSDVRLIDASALKEKVYAIETYGKQWVIDEIEIDMAPTIEPLVVRGEWITHKDEWGLVSHTECSVCGHTYHREFKTNFCPNCGADMRGAK